MKKLLRVPIVEKFVYFYCMWCKSLQLLDATEICFCFNLDDMSNIFLCVVYYIQLNFQHGLYVYTQSCFECIRVSRVYCDWDLHVQYKQNSLRLLAIRQYVGMKRANLISKFTLPRYFLWFIAFIIIFIEKQFFVFEHFYWTIFLSVQYKEFFIETVTYQNYLIGTYKSLL